MFRNLNPKDHAAILERAKQAWGEWYLKGVRPDTLIPQDTLEFWTILETEKLIREILIEGQENGMESNSHR